MRFEKSRTVLHANSSRKSPPRSRSTLLGISLLAAGITATGPASAQIPATIESELVKIGRTADPVCTAKLYRPLMPANDILSNATPLYPGIGIVRDVSFGPNPKDVVDIFTADKGAALRPVLIYVPGGEGNKIELQTKEANAFYDNIARWATKNGMVAVLMQRHDSRSWDGGARDISQMIQWLQSNISKYQGNPDRMIIWAHSTGAMSVGTYIGHPELYGPKGVGVKGIIFMSASAFNILPIQVDNPGPADMQKILSTAGKTCGGKGPMSTDGALPGRAPGQPGGPHEPRGGPVGLPPGGPAPAGLPPGGPGVGAPPLGAGPGEPPADAATQLMRSSLPQLKKTKVRIMLANGEYDMFTEAAPDRVMPLNRALHDELCKSGAAHCPTLLVAKGHSFMSLVFSIDTPDTSVSGPVLAWIKKIK